MTFTFRLQSGLGKSGYLSLKIPFQIEASVVSTVPQGVDVIYNEVSTTDCSPISKFPGALYKDSNGWYHVKFLNLDGYSRALEANTYYRVSISSQTTFSNQVAQILSPIEALTIQDFSVNNWIKYDFNRAFALIEFTPTPPSTLVSSFTLLSTTPTLLDYRHSILVQITPTIPIDRKARIVILMTDNDYQFQGEQCTSESYKDANNTDIPALTNQQYSCQIVNNILTVNLYQIFNTTLKFSFSIKNPKFVKLSGGGFQIMSMFSYANHIVEQVKVLNILSTSALTWGINNQNLVTYFLWGLKLSDTTLPSQLKIIRDTTQNPYFNSFKFTFFPSSTTPLNLKLRVILNLNSDIGSMILEGSLQENLPQYDKNPVSCSITKVQPIKIICQNVGTLNFESRYFISIKMSFPSQATPGDLPADFGLIQLESSSNGVTYDALPLIPSGRDQLAIYSTLNSFAILSQSSGNGYTFVHSQRFSDTFACPTSSTFGLQYADYEQRLIFTARPQITTFAATVTTRTVGYYLYTNPKLQKGVSNVKAESPLQFTPPLACSPTPAVYDPPDFVFDQGDDFVDIMNTNEKYTVIQLTREPLDTATIQNVFGGNAANNLYTVSIGPVYIRHNASQFCNEDLIDFIGFTAEIGIPNKSPIVPITGIIAANSYTLSGPNQMTNLYLSIANFWTGTTVKLDGSQFPAFIRVTGFLEQSIVDKAARLAIFFNNLTPFNEEISPEGKQYVSCSSTLNRKQKCYGYVGSDDSTNALQSVYNLHRVEFILDDTFSKSGPASPFQLVIPVSTVRNVNQLTFYLATIAQNQDDKVYSHFIAFKSSLISQTMNAPAIALVDPVNAAITKTGQSYKLDLINYTPSVGQQDSAAQVYYGHTQATPVISPNSGVQQGAAFFYQGKWNMIGPNFSTKGLILNPALTYEQKCVPYHYNDFYGFLCPMIGDTIITSISQYIKIEGFNYPDKGVQTPTGGFSGWSDKNGNLQSYSPESVSTITAGQIQIPLNIFPTIQRGYQDQIVKWIFTSINSIPKDGYVSIAFTSGSWPFTVSTASFCELRSSQVAKQITHTCTISKTDGVEIRFSFAASQAFPPDTYTIVQYGVNMPDSSSNDQAYSILTYTILNMIIDSTSVGAGTLKFNNTPLIPKIEVGDVQFERMNNGMRGKFEFKFKLINRGVLYNQQINFDLTMIASSTVSKSHCSILNQDGSQNFDWKSFEGSSFTLITIRPVSDLNPENQYIFRCFNILTPNNYIAPLVKVLSGSTILSQGTASNPPLTFEDTPTVLSSTGLTLTKTYPQAYAMIELKINLVLSQPFDQKSTIYVNLPYYYNSYDNKKSLSCLMNDADAYCQYDNERTISIKLFTLTIDSFTIINLVIAGIIQPIYTYNDDQIFIMVDYDEVKTTINEYGTLSDVAVSSTVPISLIIRDFEISNVGIRTESQYTYYLTTLGNIQVGQYLVIDLPSKDYGKLVQLKPPTACSGVLESDGITSIISKCETLGNRILLQFEGVLQTNTKYIVKISGMTNMEASSCYIGLPIFSLITSDKTQIQQLSTYVYSNIQQFKLIADSTKKTMYWKEETDNDIKYTIEQKDDILRLNYNELLLKPGQYSNIISLGQINGGYDKKLRFSINSNSGFFKVINDLIVYPGDGKALTRIGCSGSTNPQSYYLYFSKDESEPLTYSEAGIIQVMITTTKTEISTQFSSYDVPLFMKSIPVLIDFSENIPVEDLLIDFELIPFDIDKPAGLKFQSTSDTKMNFQVTQENLKITFIIISETEVQDSDKLDTIDYYYSTLLMTFSGNSAPYYVQSSTQTQFKLVKDNTDVIKKTGCIYLMQINQLSDYSNKQIITFKSDQDLIIYYHAIMLNGFERNLDDVKLFSENNTQLRYSDYYQEQFGQIYLKSKNDYHLELKKLKARTWYKIKSWAVNLYDIQNETQYVEFFTQNNNGRLIKLTFHFGTELNAESKKAIACWLCYTFAYPCYDVLSYDAIFCSDSINKDLSFNSTTVYSQYKMLQETNTTTDETPTDDNNQDENTQDEGVEVDDGVETAVQFYFIPNQDLPNDINWKQVIAGVEDTNFMRYFVGNLTNSTRLFSVDPFEEITFDKSPEIISNIKFTRGLTWLSLSDIRLRQTGLVWGYITPKFSDGTYASDGLKPTNIQMKYFANCLNQSISSNYYFIKYYSSESISHNFTDLQPSKWYNIYLIATQDSPSLWTETSPVYSFTNKTLRKPFDEPAAIYDTLLLPILIIWLIQ
ncbi:unnamed protein product [Paramecium primaurelia]|uniref:Uncharacterized protein n=1 Tax=Paramecium primaurelia TaxID=5886 RepID=A0A8S1JTC1_PARPR|nr:unnamed protein product [Paramecium primaurelia]